FDGNDFPDLMPGLTAGGRPGVQNADDFGIVSFVHSDEASTRKEPAGKPSQYAHLNPLDPWRAGKVTSDLRARLQPPIGRSGPALQRAGTSPGLAVVLGLDGHISGIDGFRCVKSRSTRRIRHSHMSDWPLAPGVESYWK